MDYFVVKSLRDWHYRREGNGQRSGLHTPAISYRAWVASLDRHREIPGASEIQKVIVRP
jgi:hypothetical protein